jgi:uncharacterized zinc-type alcohol dehydrogenase-like protein
VLSHSLKKQEEAKKMGADNFYDVSDRETLKKLRGYFDIIISTVSVELDSNKYMKLLDVDGTMIVVGLPEKEIQIAPFSLVSARDSLQALRSAEYERLKKCLISAVSTISHATLSLPRSRK